MNTNPKKSYIKQRKDRQEIAKYYNIDEKNNWLGKIDALLEEHNIEKQRVGY